MKDNPKVAVIGLNVMDEKDAFQGWVQKNQSKYTFTFSPLTAAKTMTESPLPLRKLMVCPLFQRRLSSAPMERSPR